MKKILFTLIVFMVSVAFTYAQSTEITPGTVLPSMTTAQRTALLSPTNGTLVFDSTTQSYWYRQSGVWIELPKGGSTSNYWQLSGLGGNEITNTNSGGFWSVNPVGLNNSSDNVSNPPTAPINGDGTRLLWIPSRSAFRAGTISGATNYWDAPNIGLFSTAFGSNTLASGSFSFATGINTKALGTQSTAMGSYAIASGAVSAAIGYLTLASGKYSTAINYGSKATGDYSTSIGAFSTASGIYSNAMGLNTDATGNYSTAMGNATTATDSSSTAMGGFTTADGKYSTAMGKSTLAGGNFSTSMGIRTKANGANSFAAGYETTASGNSSVAMGNATLASGTYSAALGYDTKASGFTSTAIGYKTTASGSNSTAMGNYASTNNRNGSLAIGDNSTIAVITNSADDQFIARFAGGYRFYSNAAQTIGASLNAGASSWSSISDSTKKENFMPANGERVLKSVSEMRIGTWNYKTQDPASSRHWGVMAQDFYAHFGKDNYGTIGNDTTIATGDFDGVSFAAIKALEARSTQLKMENEALKLEINALKKNYSQIRAENDRLKTDTEIRFAKLESLLLTKQKSVLTTGE